MTGILGKNKDEGNYRQIADNAKKAFCCIATEDGKINSVRQAEYVRAITFDLLAQEKRPRLQWS